MVSPRIENRGLDSPQGETQTGITAGNNGLGMQTSWKRLISFWTDVSSWFFWVVTVVVFVGIMAIMANAKLCSRKK
jgi:hypothetical protein